MKKRRAKRTAAAVARGHARALARRGIKLDKAKRPRKDGRPITVAKLERAVAAIKRAETSKPARKKPQEKKRPSKTSTKKRKQPQRNPAVKPKPRPIPTKELSERDTFIIESLRRNHLDPAVRKNYLKALSSEARKFFKPENELWLKRDRKLGKHQAKPKSKITASAVALHSKRLQQDRESLLKREEKATKKGLGPIADTEDLQSLFPNRVETIKQPKAPASEPKKLLIKSDHRSPVLVASLVDARAAAKHLASFANPDAKKYTASMPILAKRPNAGSNAKKTRKDGLYVGWEGTHGEATTIAELEDRIFETIRVALELGNGEPMIVEGIHLNERE